MARLARRPQPMPRTGVAALVAALVLGCLSPLAAAPADAAVTDPLVHYAIDDDDVSSGTLTDSSPSGLHGTLVNGGTAGLTDAGSGGLALTLPGGQPSTGAYVRLPKEVLQGRTDLTLTARVRWDGGGAWQRVLDLGQDTSRYLFLTPASGDGKLRTAMTTSFGGGERQVTGSAALPTEQWRTLAVTLDTESDRLTTYLDGAAVGWTDTAISAGELLGNASSGGYLGRSMYPDPLFDGAIDDFAVYDAALSAEQLQEATGVQPPEPTEVKQTAFQVTTAIGEAPELPESAPASFSDGYDRPVRITWDEVDPDQYASRGTFEVDGTVAGENGPQTVTATVRVIQPGEIKIDLGRTTGAFHGGASGTLYGVYGDGVPTRNLIDGMKLRTVSTKAQDGPQHPGADALEVVKPLADATDGKVFIYMTDIHRGFPYEWPGETPEQKLDTYVQKVAKQVDQVQQLPEQYQDNVVFVPFNEPEGNMFGTGPWSYDRTSWLNDPTDYFAAWDRIYRLIKGEIPQAQIAGPNTSVLFAQVKGFMEHTIDADTVPDYVTWHELSHPEAVRESVKRYRTWEQEFFAGTPYEGTELPINVNEYAFNYHTSVPGQMIQWVSAIEESKVDADIAYWNIDGNLSDSAVQANRGNGQWWLFNAYAGMTGDTVEVTPPQPGRNYTLQGVASLDTAAKQARTIMGGADGRSVAVFDNVPAKVFGDRVHAWIREIPWTGQIGDSAQPQLLAERNVDVVDGEVTISFGEGELPALTESSAYEIVLTPAGAGTETAPPTVSWKDSYEAEDATYSGDGYSRNGPEGSPADVGKFYTSGGFDVGGLRTGSDGVLTFSVDVPKTDTYDLSVFANSLNTYPLVQEHGPTNVFVRVDGADEQGLRLPLGYKWVVWDHADVKVRLTEGTHKISLAAKSLDGTSVTHGDAIVDRLTLTLRNPAATPTVYEAETAETSGAAKPAYTKLPHAGPHQGVSGSGGLALGRNGTATFWVYSANDAEATIRSDVLGPGAARLSVNGREVGPVSGSSAAAVSLSGGVNKVTVTGTSARTVLDRIAVSPSSGSLVPRSYEAEDATLAGSAKVTDLSQAGGGRAVTDVGGEPGNHNTITFDVTAGEPGRHVLRVRYSNPEQSPPSHYNPDPIARHADISVNGRASERVLFPHSFHQNNFWVLTVPVDLKPGRNTVRFTSEELPNFDGKTYASDEWSVPLRSKFAPILDRLTVAPFAKRLPGKGKGL